MLPISPELAWIIMYLSFIQYESDPLISVYLWVYRKQDLIIALTLRNTGLKLYPKANNLPFKTGSTDIINLTLYDYNLLFESVII